MNYCPTCRHCGVKLAGHLEIKRCPKGYCQLWCCADCGEEYASDGPVGCPSCSPISWWGRVTIAVYGWWLRVSGRSRD